MVPDSKCQFMDCPAPFTRAPRCDGNGGAPHDSLGLAPPSLQGALIALIRRDTSRAALDAAQRLSHFPASPMVTLSWYHGMDVGLVEPGDARRGWRPFGASVLLAGSQTHPLVTWEPTTGRGYMACFAPDAAQLLFGVDLAAIQDRFAPAHELLGSEWTPLWDALLAAGDETAAMAALERFLAPRWRAVTGGGSALLSLRQFGRHWVEKLAWQAHDWHRTRSPRQVERRIKSLSGRSLRQWQALTRTEGLFFAARDRYESGGELDWATLALDEGFADQSHMSRAARQISGFAPNEFAKRFIEDETFWVYRLWV